MKWSKWPSGSLATALKIAVAGGAFLAAGIAVVPQAEAAQLRRATVNVHLEGVAAITSHVRRSLPRHLARELAANPVLGYPPGARLIVNVQTVYLGSGGGGRFGSGSSPDALDGEALVIDGAGNVILRKAVAGRSSPNTSVVNAARNEPRRIEELVANFAYWVVRELP
jgi:hypothetical protein